MAHHEVRFEFAMEPSSRTTAASLFEFGAAPEVVLSATEVVSATSETYPKP